ncbi:hypothetical protein CVT24_007379 [Panaeolus cyanescens]|uniref:BTB domain-containing protein n=1 Tax=Panaeolus cyanescens TaxID=181874 RepID=A0A409YKZ8_9AGAR|nr:hypothetical protein CVT24_007379 [Panaeolus cyanescens]
MSQSADIDTSNALTHPPPNPIPEPTPAAMIRNRRYGSLGSIYFSVGNEIFEVPRIAFEGRQGTPFADAALIQQEGHGQLGDGCAIANPASSNSKAEGYDAMHPVKLEGITTVDFENLCHVLFRSIVPGAVQDVTNEEWTSALRLSTMWNMRDIRDEAIAKLTEMIKDPVELILAAREFGVPVWFLDGCYALAMEEPRDPTVMSESIGLDTAYRLLHVQYQYQYQHKSKKRSIARQSQHHGYLDDFNNFASSSSANAKPPGNNAALEDLIKEAFVAMTELPATRADALESVAWGDTKRPEVNTPIQTSTVQSFEPSEQFFFNTIDFLVEGKVYRVPRLSFENRDGSPFATAADLQSKAPKERLFDYGSATSPAAPNPQLSPNRKHGRMEKRNATCKYVEFQRHKVASLIMIVLNEQIRKMAKDTLSTQLTLAESDPCEILICGRELKVLSWFTSGCHRIVVSPTPIHPIKYGKRLGLETASKLLYLQSKHLIHSERPIAPADWVTTLMITAHHIGVALHCPQCKTEGRLCHDKAFGSFPDDPLKDARVFPLRVFTGAYAQEPVTQNWNGFGMRINTMQPASGTAFGSSGFGGFNNQSTPVVTEQPKWRSSTFSPVDTASEKMKTMIEEEFKDELEEIRHEENCYDA